MVKWKKYYKLPRGEPMSFDELLAKALLLSIVALVLFAGITFVLSVVRYRLFPCHKNVLTARIEQTPCSKEQHIKLYLNRKEAPKSSRSSYLPIEPYCTAPLKLSDLDAFRIYFAARSHTPSLINYDEYLASVSRVFKDFSYYAVCKRYGCSVYVCAKFHDVLLFSSHEECIEVPFEAVNQSSAKLLCIGMNCQIQKKFSLGILKHMRKWKTPFSIRVYNAVTYINALAAAIAGFFLLSAISVLIVIAKQPGRGGRRDRKANQRAAAGRA